MNFYVKKIKQFQSFHGPQSMSQGASLDHGVLLEQSLKAISKPARQPGGSTIPIKAWGFFMTTARLLLLLYLNYSYLGCVSSANTLTETIKCFFPLTPVGDAQS